MGRILTTRDSYHWNSTPRLRSYENCDTLYNNHKAKDPARGLCVADYKYLRKGDGFYELIFGGTPMVRFHKGDIIEVLALQQQMDAWVGVVFASSSQIRGQTRIACFNRHKYVHYDGVRHHRIGVRYFSGVKFDLRTGDCVNPLPEVELVTIHDKKAEFERLIKELRDKYRGWVQLKLLDESSIKVGYYNRSHVVNAVMYRALIGDAVTHEELEIACAFFTSSAKGMRYSNSKPFKTNIIRAFNVFIANNRKGWGHRFGVYKEI